MQAARIKVPAQNLSMARPGSDLTEDALLQEIVDEVLADRQLDRLGFLFFHTSDNGGDNNRPTKSFRSSNQSIGEFIQNDAFMLNRGLCLALKNFFEVFTIDVGEKGMFEEFRALGYGSVPVVVVVGLNGEVLDSVSGKGSYLSGAKMISCLERSCAKLDTRIRQLKDKELKKEKIAVGKRIKEHLGILDDIVKYSYLIKTYDVTLSSGSKSRSLEAKRAKAVKRLAEAEEKEFTVWDVNREALESVSGH